MRLQRHKVAVDKNGSPSTVCALPLSFRGQTEPSNTICGVFATCNTDICCRGTVKLLSPLHAIHASKIKLVKAYLCRSDFAVCILLLSQSILVLGI